ncbi:hypothetical protein [Streptomyces sp. NPDC057636]|uniref:hypothetical protein n=1 Tax=Streptomyces sp. NPDC057636 TaxID=3346189 RepID=UPI00368B2329
MNETLYIPAEATPRPAPPAAKLAHLVADTLAAVLVPARPDAIVPFDVVVAQVQDYAWVWHRLIPSADVISDVLRACRAEVTYGVHGPVAVHGLRIWGPEL